MCIYFMETKSIKVSVGNWKKLMQLRIETDSKSMDKLIEKFFEIIPINKLKKEVQK